MNSYSRLLYFVKPYYKRMLFAVFCMIVAAAAYLVVPWLIKNVVDQVLDEKNMFMLNLIVGAIILIFLIRGFATYGQTYNMSYIGQRVIIDVREAIFNHLQKLSLSYFDRRKTGVIMSNLTNDVAALQTAVVDNLISFITESVTLIGSLVSMLLIDWKLTLVTFITVPVVLVIINVFGKKLRVAGHDVQGRVADITALLQEVISAVRVVKSFAREDFERKRFGDGKTNNVKVTLQADDGSQTASKTELPALDGATLNNYDAKGVKGVEISKVQPNSMAAQRGLKSGDIIIGINRQPIESTQDLRKALDEKPSAVALNILRGKNNFYLLVQ